MAGRADILAGFDAEIWYNDHESVGEVAAKQQRSMRNIPNARDAEIAESSHHAIETLATRYIPGRDAIYLPIGSSVRIADRGKWIGAYRVDARTSSNLIVEYGRRLL